MIGRLLGSVFTMPSDSEYRLNPEFIAEATGGEVVLGSGVEAYSGVCVDTRKLRPGMVFFALKGNRDGHEFVKQALEKGAGGVVIEKSRILDLYDTCKSFEYRAFCVAVEDTLQALTDLAIAWVDMIRPVIIGVTGSVGKTTTKGLIASALSGAGRVRATIGNYNNHIGLPISVLRLRPGDRFGVFEYGTSGYGEIKHLTQIVRPRVAVVTAVGHSHLEGFKDLDGVAKEKSELVRALPEDGIAVLNADDQRVKAMAEFANRVVYFGYSDDADVRIVDARVTPTLHTQVVLQIGNRQISFILQILGLHYARNAAAAVAVAMALGMEPEKAIEGLKGYKGESGRMNVVRTLRGYLIVDDTYNASRESIKGAIATLKTIDRPLVVALGDVKELGEQAERIHQEIAQLVAESKPALFIAMGDFAHVMAHTAVKMGMLDEQVHVARDHSEAIGLIHGLSPENAVVLIKGSRAMKMDLVVQGLAAKWNTMDQRREDN